MNYLRIIGVALISLVATLFAKAAEPADSTALATDSLPGYHELNEVEVTAKAPLIQNEADRISYNVADDPSSASNNALEMMRKIPLLTVDGDDNIKLKGEENYKIYLNGKPDPTLSSNYKEVLRSMPASTIKKIEVITEPGAKYDAEGLGGIINIITFSGARLEGYLLNLGIYTSQNNTGEYLYGTMKINKVTLSANYSHNNYYGPSNTSMSRVTYTDPAASPAELLRWSKGKNRQYSNFGSLQMSWEPDTLNLYTISADLWASHNNQKNFTNAQYFDRQQSLVSSYIYNLRGEGDYLGSSVQANWQHNFRIPERNIVLSYKYDYGHSNNYYQYYYSDIFNFEDVEDQDRSSKYPTHEHTFQADYTNPFSKKHTLEVGGKYIIRNNYGYTTSLIRQGEQWIEDAPNCVDMKQFQDVGAIYASYIGKFGKFMGKAGIRYEFTHMGTRFFTPGHTDFTTNLSDPVPNVLLSYKLSDASNLKATYRMQVRRPSVSQLDPTVNDVQITSISYGNPDLSSERTHYAGLTYSNYAGKLGGEFTANYSRSDKLIANYAFVNQDGIICNTYGNMGDCDGLNLNAYINWRIITDMSFSMVVGTRYNHYRCSQIDLDRDGWGYNFNANFNYTLPKKWEVGAYGGLYKQGVYMQYSGSTSSWYGLWVSKSLLKEDRLNLSLQVNDFFQPMYTYKNRNEGPGYVMNSESRWHNWSISFGVRLRLGSLSVSVKQTSKSVSNDDISSGSSGSSSGGKK